MLLGIVILSQRPQSSGPNASILYGHQCSCSHRRSARSYSSSTLAMSHTNRSYASLAAPIDAIESEIASISRTAVRSLHESSSARVNHAMHDELKHLKAENTLLGSIVQQLQLDRQNK